MRDFFPKIGIPTTRTTRKPVSAQFPTTVYTDPESLKTEIRMPMMLT